jgi:hypothetical protein
MRRKLDSIFGAENDYHSSYRVRGSMGIEREQKILALIEEIEDICQSHMEEERELEAV